MTNGLNYFLLPLDSEINCVCASPYETYIHTHKKSKTLGGMQAAQEGYAAC